MNKYGTYKDSGVKWIGEIPIHWGKRKISWSFAIIGSGTTPKSDNFEYYENGTTPWLLTGDLNDGYIRETKNRITDLAIKQYSALRIFQPNSLVMAMYGATIGKLGILEIEAATNQACCVLSESEYFVIKYVFYWLLSSRQDIINLSYGGGQPNISQDIVKNLRITEPPLHEQRQIVTYLDHKTTLIDELIQKKERKIELLKEKRTAIINHAVTKGLNPDVEMKYSGVEWIGEVPEHWIISKLKYDTNVPVRYGINIGSDKYREQGIRFIRITDLTENGELLPNDGKYLSNEDVSDEFKLSVNDLLLCRSGHTVGKSYLHLQSGDYTSGGYLVRFNFGNYYKSKFIFYITKSDFYWYWIKLNTITSTIENVNGEKYSNMEYPKPSYVEITKIVKYLDEQTQIIDSTIEKEQQKIELLKEYRQSLISEVVTGKMKVI